MMFSELFIRGFRIEGLEECRGYLNNLKVIKDREGIDFNKPITFFVGENGTGKSTLLEAIALSYGFNPEGGSLGYSFSTMDSHSNLHEYMRLIKGIYRPEDGFFLRAESFYGMSTYLDTTGVDMEEYGGRSLHDQSHGEAFMNIISGRFRGEGMYILDEPEAALSPQRQLALLVAIDELVKGGSQFIIATHSPILLAARDAAIFSFDGDFIKEIEYEDTEVFNIMKMFVHDREYVLDKLYESNE